MNVLKAKATELIQMAAGYGVEAQVLTTPNYIRVEFFRNLYSIITLTETGKARVESIDYSPARSNNVSLKALPEYVAYQAANKKVEA